MKKLTTSILFALLVYLAHSQDQTINGNLTLNGTIKGNQYGALRINTGFGYLDLGPQNNDWTHIYTDRARFIFNKTVYSLGGYSSYSTDDLFLQTGGTTRMTLLSVNGNIGIGTTNPSSLLEINKVNGPLAFTIKRETKNVASIGSGTDGTGEYGILRLFNSSNENVRLYTYGDSWINGGNLGIGTASPSSLLEINKVNGPLAFTIKRETRNVASIGSGTDGTGEYGVLKLFNSNVENVRLYTYGDSWINGGNLGVGTTAPSTLLEINKAEGPLMLSVKRGENSVARMGSGTSGNGQYGILSLFNSNVEGVRLYTYGDSWINGGNLGIGTTTPQNKLDVAGTIRCTEVKVVALPWSDFVFHPTYKLRPLGEVEQFIKANNHLPEIPTETEVKQNGVGLGEMNAKLLQKIEELTLYVIEQQKQMIDLQKQVNELKGQNKSDK